MVLIKDIISKIKDILHKNPQGMTITQIARKTGINRNTVGRYLENLLVSGQVEMHRFGMKKIYSLSQRVALSSILSISSELVVQLDSSLRIIYANEPFLNLVGTDNNNLIGKNIEYTPVSMVFDELFTGFIEYIKEGVAGKEWSGEFVLSTKDIHLFCRIVPTVFDDGRKGVSVILEDITSQKKAENAMQETEDRYRKLVELSPDAFIIYQEGKFSFENPAALKLFGASNRDELSGKGIIDFVHPDFVETLRKTIQNDLEGITTQPIELPVIRLDGKQIIVEGRGVKTTVSGKPALQVTLRDMTERKRAEVALRESEEKYRNLVETTGTGYVILDKAGRVITANQEYVRLTGRPTLAEVEGRPVTDWTASYDVERNEREIEMCFTKGRVRGFEVDYQKPDGTIQPIEINASVIHSDSEPIILTLCRDITERKRAEEALCESEEKYRSFIERANDGIVVVQDGIIKLCNRVIIEFRGGVIEQILGRNFTDFIHPDSLPEVVKRYNQRMTGESPPTIYETILMRKDGSRFFAELNAGIIVFDGKPADLIIIRDINERKKIEAALRESEEKYRTLVNRANDVICVLQDGVIKMFNPRLPEFWGGSEEEIRGRPFTDFVHPDALFELISNYNRRIAGESFSPLYETTMMRKDGSRSFVELNAGVIMFEGRPADLVIARDINDRKMAQDALRRSEELYRTLSEASNDLIFVIGRDDNVEYVNSYTAAMVNKSINQIVGSPRTSFFSPEIATRQKTALDSVFATGSSVRSSSPLTFNGRTYWYDHILTPLKDPDNHVRSVLGISRDITERKVSEEALFASEKRFQSLAEMLPQSIWECDDRGNVTFVNNQTYAMYGYNHEDVEKGMTIWQTIHPDDRERVLGDFIRASMEEPGEFPTFHEFMSIRKDGSTFPLITYHVPIVHENKITGMRGIGIDISERKRAEAALKESEERFRLLVESVPFGISFITSTGTIEYANPAFEKICGYTQKEFPDLTIWCEKVFPDTEYREKIFGTWHKQIRTLTGPNLVADKIFRMHCRDGKDKDILFTAVILPDGKELVTIDDITEWKQSKRQT